jgi:hypothetical protein
VNAASAVRAITNFFMSKSLSPKASNLIALTMREHPIPKTQYRNYTQSRPKCCCGENTAIGKRMTGKCPENGQIQALTGRKRRK